MKNLARKFSQGEAAWTDRVAPTSEGEGAGPSSSTTPGRRGLPIDGSRIKGLVGSAIDTATGVPGWLASTAASLPAAGENLFRGADKPSLFRRTAHYDELDESSILNPGNVSSHTNDISPAPSPPTGPSFLGLGRQSSSSTPTSAGPPPANRVAGGRTGAASMSRWRSPKTTTETGSGPGGDVTGPGPLGRGALALSLGGSGSPAGTPGASSGAPPVRDTRPVPLSFEASPSRAPEAPDLLDLNDDLPSSTTPLNSLTSSADMVRTSSLAASETHRSSLQLETASTALRPGPRKSQGAASLKRPAYAGIPSGGALAQPAVPLSDFILSDDSAMEITSTASDQQASRSIHLQSQSTNDEMQFDSNPFGEDPFSLSGLAELDRRRANLATRAVSVSSPVPSVLPASELAGPPRNYLRSHSVPGYAQAAEQQKRELPEVAKGRGGGDAVKVSPPPKPSRPPPAPPSVLGDSVTESLRLRSDSTRSACSSQSGVSGGFGATGSYGLGESGDPPPTCSAAYDIFEPRVVDSTVPEDDVVEQRVSYGPLGDSRQGSNGAAATRELRRLKAMTGRQLLAKLEAGAPIRKKWVTHLAPAQVVASSKPTRHIRCVLEDGKVFLRYFHQGMKGLVDKEEVTSIVQRVEIPGGNWSRGKNILVFSNRGVLALEPPSATAFSLWVLGLNAALMASQARRRDFIFACPAHAIPRNSMFVINEKA